MSQTNLMIIPVNFAANGGRHRERIVHHQRAVVEHFIAVPLLVRRALRRQARVQRLPSERHAGAVALHHIAQRRRWRRRRGGVLVRARFVQLLHETAVPLKLPRIVRVRKLKGATVVWISQPGLLDVLKCEWWLIRGGSGGGRSFLTECSVCVRTILLYYEYISTIILDYNGCSVASAQRRLLLRVNVSRRGRRRCFDYMIIERDPRWSWSSVFVNMTGTMLVKQKIMIGFREIATR